MAHLLKEVLLFRILRPTGPSLFLEITPGQIEDEPPEALHARVVWGRLLGIQQIHPQPLHPAPDRVARIFPGRPQLLLQEEGLFLKIVRNYSGMRIEMGSPVKTRSRASSIPCPCLRIVER